jgi:translation initiation factor 4G
MMTVVEKKAQDVDKMADTIKFLSGENLIEQELYIRGFKAFMEGYDDLTIDVPQAPKYVAQLFHAASVVPDQVGGDEFGSLQRAYDKLLESQ